MADASGQRSNVPLIAMTMVAVLAIAALVWALVGRPTDADEPVAAGTTEAAAEPSADPSPTPTPTPEGPTTLIALTAAGDLVELSPADGSTVRTIASDAAWRGPLSLTPDRSAVYLTRDTDAIRPDIVQVSLTDGAAEVVAQGRTPSLSPDGTQLAYVGKHPTNPDEEYRALHILDLATGDITYVPDNTCGGCARRIDQPAWAPDGSRLFVAAGFMDSAVPSLDVLEVVPGTTADLDTAKVVVGGPSEPGHPGVLADGRLAVVSVVDTAPGGDSLARFQGAVETYDAATGAAAGSWPLPQLHTVTPDEELTAYTSDTAVAPTGTAMAIVATARLLDGGGTLYLWEGGAELTTLAQGIVAVTW